MTRTAADVQAEIDALIEAEAQRHDDVDVTLRGLDEDSPEAREVISTSLKASADWRRQMKVLFFERDGLTALARRLARAELDAATPPDVRATALRLRAAHRSVDGWAMGAEDPWEALDTSEAAAWAAVAREAGR